MKAPFGLLLAFLCTTSITIQDLDTSASVAPSLHSRLFGGETVERGDVVVFNNQWPHKAPTEEYRDEHNKRSDEWKNKVSKYGRRWVYVSWRNKTNKVNAMQEAVHVNSVEALFEKQYNEDASEPDEERQAKKAKKD